MRTLGISLFMTLAFSMTMPIGIAVAGDCAELPPDAWYDPDDLKAFIQGIHTQAWETVCCCYNNIVYEADIETTVIDNWCCDEAIQNCITLDTMRENAARPTATEGLTNVWEGPAWNRTLAIASTVPDYELTSRCKCGESPEINCLETPSITWGAIPIYECEDCE